MVEGVGKRGTLGASFIGVTQGRPTAPAPTSWCQLGDGQERAPTILAKSHAASRMQAAIPYGSAVVSQLLWALAPLIYLAL